MAKKQIILASLERISRKYNAENDTIPGAPAVTHTDMAITDAIVNLVSIIEEQQKTIERHEAQIDRLFGNVEQLFRR